MSFDQSQIADALEADMKKTVGEKISENVTGITRELVDAEDGNLTVSISVKLLLSGNRVAGAVSLGYARKFKDDGEFITPDPDQPPLPGIEGATVTIKTEGLEPVTVTAEQFTRAAQRVGKRGDK